MLQTSTAEEEEGESDLSVETSTTDSGAQSGIADLNATASKRANSASDVVGPRKKPRLSTDKEDATTSALRTAAEVMSTVCQRMVQPKQQQPQQPTNATRGFCDMLYHQLMSFDELEREEIQFEMQQVVMQHRRRTYTYNCATDPSTSAATSISSLLASAHQTYYDM